MKVLKALTALALAASLGASGAWAQATPNFDYFGYVKTFPVQVGGAYKYVGYLDNNGVIPTPIPMVWGAGVQHTIVIEAELASHTVSGPVITDNFMNATVRIYTDNGPVTAYAFTSPNPTGFDDQDLILSGTIDGFFRRKVFTTYTYYGSVDWTGGSRLGEIGANTQDWGLGGGGSSQSSTVPSGYDHVYDGLIQQPVVAVEDKAWGGVKQLYRSN
jgi:hypothetical protein